MSSRAERKQAAELRRLEWRTRWTKIARDELVSGKNIEQAMKRVATDMQRIARETPQLSSEVIRAGNEFVRKVTAAIIKAGQVRAES